VFGEALHLHLRPDDHDWYRETGRAWMPLTAFDAVIIRRDPPLRFRVPHRHLAARTRRSGWRACLQRPRALREHSEKLALMEFAEWVPPTLVSRDMPQVQHFIDAQRDVILKPLDAWAAARFSASIATTPTATSSLRH
jgi:glutathione synthase